MIQKAYETFLVVQYLRLRAPNAGAHVPSLVRELKFPTCHIVWEKRERERKPPTFKAGFRDPSCSKSEEPEQHF